MNLYKSVIGRDFPSAVQLTEFNRFQNLLTDTFSCVCEPDVVMIYREARQSIGLALSCLLCAFFALVLSPRPAWAEAVDCVVSSSAGQAEALLPRCDELYPDDFEDADDSPWRFGIGAGYGKRTNPLINSDNVPVYGVIQLSYFGERFFFDNGDLGWVLADVGDMSVNLIAGVGGERSFYSAFNKSSVSFGQSTGVDSLPPDSMQNNAEAPEAPDRDYVIDAGLEVLYQAHQLEWQLQVLGDVSGNHDSAELWLSVSRPWSLGRWSVLPVIGVNWLSGGAADYYYGVKASEALPSMPAYRADAAVNPFVRLALHYRLSDHWSVIVAGQYGLLADEISDSSAVADDHTSTFFSGLFYEF